MLSNWIVDLKRPRYTHAEFGVSQFLDIDLFDSNKKNLLNGHIIFYSIDVQQFINCCDLTSFRRRTTSKLS